jgi:hypothetical protein
MAWHGSACPTGGACRCRVPSPFSLGSHRTAGPPPTARLFIGLAHPRPLQGPSPGRRGHPYRRARRRGVPAECREPPGLASPRASAGVLGAVPPGWLLPPGGGHSGPRDGGAALSAPGATTDAAGEGAIAEGVVRNLLAWPHTGFGTHVSRAIPTDATTPGIVARHMARPPITPERMLGEADKDRIIYFGTASAFHALSLRYIRAG